MRVRQTYLVGLLLFICWSCTDTVKFDRLASNATCSTPSGVLDTTFGTSGAVQVDNPLSYLDPNKTDLINSMIADSSGSIFVTGKTWDDATTGGGTNFNFFIGKYNSSLQVDNTFGGGDGFVEKSAGGATSAEEVGNDIKLLSTGEIITTGSILNGGTTDILISKWNLNGTVETSSVTIDGIGINDCATAAPSQDDAGNALAVDSSDNLYITGYCLDDSGDKNFLVIKTNSAGTIDTLFGTDGVWNFSPPGLGTNEEGRDIVLTKSGSLIVGGTRENGNSSDTLLVKLTPSGDTVNTFAGDGEIDAFVDGPIYKGQINALVLDTDENIYAAGRTHNGSNWDMTVWKYTPSGILDASWGTSGRYVFNNGSEENAFDIKIDPCSGNIIVFGFIKSISSTREDSTIWRLSKTGSLDTSFGSGSGYVSNSLTKTNNDRANSGIITSGGKYITGGRVKEDTVDTGCGAGAACDLFFTVWE